LQAFEDEKSLLDSRTKEYADVEENIQALEEAHETKLTQIHNQAELERQQFSIQAAQAVQNAFATFIDTIVNHTKSLKAAFSDMIKSLVADLNKLAANKMAEQLFGGGTAGGGFLSSLFSGGGGGGFDLSSLFSGIGSFAVGSAYIPRTQLAVLHAGEAVIPASQNRPGRMGGNLSLTTHFHLSGPIDTRTRDQINADQAMAIQKAQRNL
jgi:Lambda phage tail tape-measure protein (Tape_meas_lam_C)